MVQRQFIVGNFHTTQRFIVQINFLVNLANVMKIGRIFKKPQRKNRINNFIAVVRINVDKIYDNAAFVRLLRKFYGVLKIFSSIVYKIFVGVEKNNPIARSLM